MATEAAQVIAAPTAARWRAPLLALGAVLIGVSVLYAGTVRSMVAIWWRSETFAHGFLILPIALYLIWKRRAEIARERPVASALGVGVVVLAALAWAVAARIDVLLGQQLAFVTLIVGAVWGVLGTRLVRILRFPLAYLYFAVPMGDGLIPPLRDFTGHFSVYLLQLTHMPVLLEGRYIVIPSGTFEVAEACAGLRYLIASVVLGTVYAYLAYRGLWRRVVFIAFAILVPILANGVRAAGIVGLAYLSDMHLATGVDHIVYGWIFFGFVMFVLFWAGQFLREPETAGAEPARTPATRPAAAAPATRSSSRAMAGAALALVAAAGLGPGALYALGLRAARVTEPAAMTAPAARPPWSGPFATADSWRPVFPGAGGTFLKVYRSGDRSVFLYSAYYPRERQGAELIRWGTRLYDGRRWVRIGSQSREVALGAGRRMRVIETEIRSGDVERLVWSWYRIGTRRTVDPLAAKLLEAWEDLRHGGTDAAVVAVAADYTVGPQQARRVLARFLRAMGPVAPVASPPARR